jgi:TonB family protein
MHSLRQQRTFYYILGAFLLLHTIFLFKHYHPTVGAYSEKPSAIKVKIVQDAMKELANSQKRQIVQSEETQNKDKKDEAFLSDKDRSFERETVAKNIDIFKKTAQGNSDVTQAAQKSQSAKKKAPNLKDLKLSDIGMASGDPLPKEVSRAPASSSQKGLENGDPMEQGFSATNDYVQEVQLGDFTHLNTVEYKYYGFFHRIRQKLEQFWGKSIQEKSMAIFRSGRKIASQDYVTSLQVTLNARGEIIGVKILGASGVKELDDAAVESFNEAGPFPNPPKDLLVNGKATIEWGFVVKT